MAEVAAINATRQGRHAVESALAPGASAAVVKAANAMFANPGLRFDGSVDVSHPLEYVSHVHLFLLFAIAALCVVARAFHVRPRVCGCRSMAVARAFQKWLSNARP